MYSRRPGLHRSLNRKANRSTLFAKSSCCDASLPIHGQYQVINHSSGFSFSNLFLPLFLTHDFLPSQINSAPQTLLGLLEALALLLLLAVDPDGGGGDAHRHGEDGVQSPGEMG